MRSLRGGFTLSKQSMLGLIPNVEDSKPNVLIMWRVYTLQTINDGAYTPHGGQQTPLTALMRFNSWLCRKIGSFGIETRNLSMMWERATCGSNGHYRTA